jgi:hypothetical protein
VMNSRRLIQSPRQCDVSGRRRPALQDASKYQADHDDGADQHADRGQSAFASEGGFAHSGIV